MNLGEFQYLSPKGLSEAVSLLIEYGKVAKIIAGGTDLLPLIKRGIISPRYIINIKKIPDLNTIHHDENGLTIGALVTIRTIEKSAAIRREYHLLYEAASLFGTIQVRNMATLGGNLCRASPAADMAPPLLALDAEVNILGSAGKRTILLQEFFTNSGKTMLRYDDILTEVRINRQSPSTGTAFLKTRRTAEDLAKASTAVSLTMVSQLCEDVRIALGAVAPTPIRAVETEDFLRGKRLDDEVMEEAAIKASTETRPITDVRSSAEYRKEVVKVLVRRALKIAMQRVTQVGK